MKEPVLREVTVKSDPEGTIHNERTYTVPEAATALGKTMVTLKRWIKERLIPPPVLKGTSYGYMHYSEEELQSIADILREHEKQYDYLHYTHTQVINRIWQVVEGQRKVYQKSGGSKWLLH